MGWGSGIAESSSVDRRRGSDLELPWLSCRLAAATPIPPSAWELPHAGGAVLKKPKRKKKKKIYSFSEVQVSEQR